MRAGRALSDRLDAKKIRSTLDATFGTEGEAAQNASAQDRNTYFW
jgi:hypothetical protein